MDFLFGKKYPIFNKKGEIQHERPHHFNQWKKRYTEDPDKSWKNHSGLFFKSTKSKKP